MNNPAASNELNLAASLTSHRPHRPAEGASAKPTLNDAESPLAWLRNRRDRAGQPLISEAQYLAGERLRMEFERSMLARRTTTNWDMAGTGGRGGNAAAEMSEGAIAARQRYHKAMDAVGPELSSILLHVCCMAAGLEQAERNARWLATTLQAELGEPVPVTPILTLPGWWVEQKPSRDSRICRVANPKVLPALLPVGAVVLDQRQINAVAAKLEARCRDVEY